MVGEGHDLVLSLLLPLVRKRILIENVIFSDLPRDCHISKSVICDFIYL